MDTIPPLSLPILLDGATGSELYKRGMPAGACTEQWVLGHPEALLELQRGYVAAGSQVLIAPTFGANRVRLEQHGIFGQVADYNRRLVELSRQAAGGRALVAGDMAPTGLFIAPFGESSFEELVAIYTEQAAALAAAGVDLFLIETTMTMPEARAAVLACKSVSDRPVWVTFTCDENGRTLSGTDVLAALIVMQGMGVDAFGLNCSSGPAEMLEQMRGGRKVLWQMKKADPELENAKNIRFITSSYEDRFKIPDGSAVEIEHPNRKFSARCEYMDEYHLRLGYDVLHICQLAEMLERGGGTCRPEPLITEECSAWDLGSKGFLAIQTCEDGYDYTLYHKDFTEIDGGQLDNPEISMNAARDQILSDYGFGGRTMTRIDYDELCDHAEDAEISRRESVLGKLSDLSSRTDTPVKAAKVKEAER